MDLVWFYHDARDITTKDVIIIVELAATEAHSGHPLVVTLVDALARAGPVLYGKTPVNVGCSRVRWQRFLRDHYRLVRDGLNL